MNSRQAGSQALAHADSSQPSSGMPSPSLRRAASLLRVVPAPSTTTPRADELRQHLLFADLSHAQLATLQASCSVEMVEAGQRLYERGQRARHFFLLLEGQMHLALHSSQGEEKIVEIIPPGEVFAEAVMFLEESTYQLTACAAVTSRIARFDSALYLQLLQENPGTCVRMLGHMSRRLHGRIRDIEHLTFASANDRLVRLLLARLTHDGPQELQLTESRQELAALLSMQPETLSRSLRTLSASGALRAEGRRLHVQSRAALAAQLQSPH
jgi:CRP/FNR family transcriptional regulator, dissimilatory nitrate respiration regulator